MELLKFVLPSEVVSKVRLYHSHPVADLLNPWIFKFKWGNAEENPLPEFDYTRKQFHLVILDTLSRERGFNHCDCCAELWDDCQCWCDNCGDEYNVCRYNCYQEPMCNCPDGCRVHNLA